MAKFTHVEEWIEDTEKDIYARFMFNHFRLQAALRMEWDKFVTNKRKLFAAYKGERFRVTGASRMGDVWLATDFNREHGYNHRVAVDDLSDFGPQP